MVEDESIFTYENKIKKRWAKKGSKPRIIQIGSKQKSYVFGSLSESGQQLFRQYPKCNQNYFLQYVKELKRKFSKMILYLDRAPWHKTSRKISQYLKKHQKEIIVKWLPPKWPELNPVEECWKQGKNHNRLGLKFHPTFPDFRKAITTYYKTHRFRLNLFRYLCR
jgi:transposase